MSVRDILVILRDLTYWLAWVVGLIFLFSGVQDLVYDIGAYSLRLFRRIYYRKRERLTLPRLRDREQQRIAVMVPAWNEGEVVGMMVQNIIERVEYKNYLIFVGTYPNDQRTQDAVNRLAAQHPQLINVVNPKNGPTTKADCLNNVYRTIRAYEDQEGINFDIFVMHDSEDVVHPHSFMLFNYLIPRVDAIQLPILPLPTRHTRVVHWTYADEFSETHMKDVPVREKVSGFVPFAGTGTGFSRRAFTTLEMQGRAVFNEESMTEDYSMSKRMREAGLTIVFVNLVLDNPDVKYAPWVPLCRRPEFISNWAFFPMDFTRSVRQKTRWIIGISLQEWESTGWSGDPRMIENLIKDRKVFVSAATALLGYVLLTYFLLFYMGEKGVVPFQLLPVIEEGSTLHRLVLVDTSFMVLRMVQRVVFVGMVYGATAGLLSIPRLAISNIVNGLAAYRALQTFARARQGKTAVRWDNTDHLEGVGTMPSAQVERVHNIRSTEITPTATILQRLRSDDPAVVVSGLEVIPKDLRGADRDAVLQSLYDIANHKDTSVRAAFARVMGFLTWPELTLTVLSVLHDRKWVVRANCAKALLKYPNFEALVESALMEHDPLVREILVRSIEQNRLRQETLLPKLSDPNLAATRTALVNDSSLIREMYLREVGMTWDEYMETELQAA
ncbi:glycosyltransferase [Fimbriimonas ginsengisoli]|uniref:Bacteriophage N4 adsorption protein B n=1 Tax=Fimbriimonas ginsengisoli Gsoil 348 TaxID=661478 RepID=A0A068NWE9_FIMGI|nr:glycosyltransferase [Fimbriimonas ginsengisoli]AIE87781.1 Bacteriophage N4 adsorption protein B [Fimbriimonas ginsengisoli Gsoil 348]